MERTKVHNLNGIICISTITFTCTVLKARVKFNRIPKNSKMVTKKIVNHDLGTHNVVLLGKFDFYNRKLDIRH